MRFGVIALILSSLLAACGPESEGPELGRQEAPLLAGGGEVIPGEYIVVLKEGASPHALAAWANASARQVYTSAVNGFAAALDAQQLRALRSHPAVAYVEQDQVMHALGEPVFQIETVQSNAPWGLDRIDQRALPLSGTYSYTANGSGVSAYIIDTGLETTHPEFGTRALNVYDYAGGTGADCNGAGTRNAGIVGGSTYGVAKGVLLRGVRVLDCSGAGTTSNIIAAVDWVRTNAVKPAVALMAFGGGLSSTLNTAVTNLSNAGIFVGVGSGSSSSDACNYSPASAAAVTTVAGTTSTDDRMTTANYGSCVDLYAPGANIPSAWIGGGVKTLASAAAAPHVVGVAALYKAAFGDASSATVDTWLKNNATAGVVVGNPAGTPNRLLYKSSL